MPKTPLSIQSQFVVGENRVQDYVMAFIFFTIAVYGFTDAASNEFTNVGAMSYIFILFGAPALMYMAKARSRRVYIRINKTGIYQDEQPVTEWKNFLSAYIDQYEVVGGIQDNFILVVEYMKDGSEAGFRRKIPLSNTQNKTEEQVLEAVNFFREAYKKENGF